MTKKLTTYTWAFLPFVFSSAAVLTTPIFATPSTSQKYEQEKYEDARQVSRASHQYVGGKTSIGAGVTDNGDVDVEFGQVISEGQNHSTGVGLWAGYDIEGNDKGLLGHGAQINHNWVSRDKSGQASHVNKIFAAYDRTEAGHDKATVGYGRENQNLFWDAHVSKGLSGRKDGRQVGNKIVSDRAYEYGVGGNIGKFIPDANVRVRAGLEHEWSDNVGAGEKDAHNTTVSAGLEKFFQGTGHSVSVDVSGSKRSGGYNDGGSSDADVTGRVGYRYNFGGAFRAESTTRRVRVEVPGQATPPRYEQRTQYKRVPTYKTVPVYSNKHISAGKKRLVKSTMELEGQTFFKLNSSKLIPSAKTRLKQVADEIRKTGYKGSIRITGNTCGLGDAAYDQKLSERRANSVKRFLIKNGFNPDHLVSRGLGKAHPKYPNVPGQGFKNRRVDIEYVAEIKRYVDDNRDQQQRVQTGTRQVVSGFKNVPVGTKNVLIDNGKPGTPRVIWKTETINNPPAWISRALHNNIKHDRSVNTFQTTEGSPVTPGNQGPVASNDSTKVECGQSVAINVLGNDTDANNDALSVISFTQPANGNVTRGSNGELIYTANTNSCGVDDQFTYTISDGNGGTDTATVTIAVEDDDKVVASNEVSTTEEGEAVTIDVLSNDDADATITRIVSAAANGVVTIVNDKLVYTPNPGFYGVDKFTYEVKDPSGNVDTAIVTVTVKKPENTAPIAINDSATTAFNQSVTLDTLSNDSDPDGDSITITDVSDPQNGTAVINGGEIVYTPDTGFIGTETFTYTISDGNGGTATATETVIVSPPGNVAPNAIDDSSKVACSGDVVINVLGNDNDPDGDTLTIDSFTQPANGTVTKGANGQLVYSSNGASCDINDSFTYTISDGNGGTDTATVTVVVDPAENTSPIAVDDTKTTAQDTPVNFDSLSNDSDPDNDTLTISSVGTPSHGSAVISGTQIIYTPEAGYVGEDSFTYTISDGNGGTATATERVTITPVTAPNKMPIAQDDSVTTDQNTPVTLNTLANDSDPDGDNLTITSVGTPSDGKAVIDGDKIVYTPDPGFVGEDSFTYFISDGRGGTATAIETITVNAVTTPNQPPVAQDDSATTSEGTPVTLATLANDSDPDGDSLTITSVATPDNGSAVINGQTIVYTPEAGFSGTDTFEYTISDGNGGTATATETVIVTAVNKAPNAINDTATTGCSVITIDVLDNDTDPDGDTLSIVSVTGANLGTAVVSGNTIVYSPSNTCGKGHTGVDNLSYTITDGNGHNATAGITVNVEGVTSGGNTNAEADDVTTTEGTPVTINVLANDAGNGLKIIAVDSGSNGNAVISGNQIVYTPNPGFTGTESIWYDIVDENGYNDAALIVIFVEAGCPTGTKCN